jgi:hypothetical protein
MFGLFRKKKSIVNYELTVHEKAFIGAITSALASKYPQFQKQLESDCIAYVSRNASDRTDSFVFGLYQDKWNKLSDRTVPNFDIRNILFNSLDDEKVVVDLYVSENLMLGYKCGLALNKINMNSIEICAAYEHHFLNKDLSEIEPFLRGIPKEKLNQFNLLSNAYKIRINNNDFIVVHDKGDGEFIGLDFKGKVFHLTHDPFQVQKISNSVGEFLEITV